MPRSDGAGDGDGGLHGEHGAQALAPGEDRVAHGAVDRRRNGVDRGDQRFERAVSQLCAFLDQRFHVGGHSHFMIPEVRFPRPALLLRAASAFARLERGR